MSKFCCLQLPQGFLAGDDLIVKDCPKLKGEPLLLQSLFIKGGVYAEVPTRALLRKHKYTGDEQCFGCKKCLPQKPPGG